jgi:hypothetical protein
MKRRTTELSESLQRKLNAYALAASAAGVGVLALTQPAEGRVVYTPAHEYIEPGATIPLDLTHNGRANFSFRDMRNYASAYSTQGVLLVSPTGTSATHNGVLGAPNTRFFYSYKAFALGPGVTVGPGGPPFSGAARRLMAEQFTIPPVCSGPWCEPWCDRSNRFLGLKFNIKGQTYYGWARLKVHHHLHPIPTVWAILTGYAYESIPNKAIITGNTKGEDDSRVEQANPADPDPGASVTNPISGPAQPASLGALATGAHGLSIWRRKEGALQSN